MLAFLHGCSHRLESCLLLCHMQTPRCCSNVGMQSWLIATQLSIIDNCLKLRLTAQRCAFCHVGFLFLDASSAAGPHRFGERSSGQKSSHHSLLHETTLVFNYTIVMTLYILIMAFLCLLQSSMQHCQVPRVGCRSGHVRVVLCGIGAEITVPLRGR